MKTNEASFFVFLASIIVGVLISMNVNFGKSNNMFLNPEDYSKAYNERNELYKDISKIKNDYYKTFNKLEKYIASAEDEYTILKEFQKELDNNKMALGLFPVEGEGIKITLNDADAFSFYEYDVMYKVVHDYDIIQIINDLRNAGAEAISVNGVRVITNTYSYCGGSNIDLGGVKIVAPFYINAVGNKKVLKNYLILNDTHYKELIGRGIRTDIQVVDNVKIPAYTGKLNPKYMQYNEK